MTFTKTPSIALVHDWMATYAGSEKVVEQMLAEYTDAPLHVLFDFLPEAERGMLRGHEVITSWLQRLPLVRKKYRGLLPILPLAVEQFDLGKYDIVLSSSHAVAKGVLTRAGQLHVCYTHTPIRYAWDLQHQYLQESRLTWGVRSLFARMILHYIRIWDYAAAQRVDVFVANSHYIAQRIRKAYGRESVVVYPPVDVEKFQLCYDKEDYYLTASRLVPYKKVDILIEAFRRMPEKKLVVIGDGPMYKSLATNLPANVEMLGYQSDDVLIDKMQHARAFLFAAEEDFGIIPVEAQACGTPVIAYGRGGSLETVVDGVTGRFFAEQTAESVKAAVRSFDTEYETFDPDEIRAHAERFNPARFRRELADVVERSWQEFQDSRGIPPAPTGTNRRNQSFAPISYSPAHFESSCQPELQK